MLSYAFSVPFLDGGGAEAVVVVVVVVVVEVVTGRGRLRYLRSK